MKPSRCYTTEELADYSVGGGHRGWRLRAEEHIAACSECKKELIALGEVDKLLAAAPLEQAPDLWSSIAPKLDPRKNPWFLPAPQLRSRALAAAGAAIVLVAGVFILQEPIGQAPPQVSAVELEHVDTHLTMSWGDPFADAASLAVLSSEHDEGRTQ